MSYSRNGLAHNYHRYLTADMDDEDEIIIEGIRSRNIKLLPAKASDLKISAGWSSELREILTGVYNDHTCVLSALRGMEDTVLRHIFSFCASEWAKYVTLTIPAGCVGSLLVGDRNEDYGITRFYEGRGFRMGFDELKDIAKRSTPKDGYVSFVSCGQVAFPLPQDRNVNMMPFVFGDEFSLPDDLRCYHALIEKCPYLDEEIGKVGYLTVHESYIEVRFDKSEVI